MSFIIALFSLFASCGRKSEKKKIINTMCSKSLLLLVNSDICFYLKGNSKPGAAAQLVGGLPRVHKAWASIMALCNPSMATRACNPSTWEVQAGGSRVQSHPWLCGEFEDSLSHMCNLVLEGVEGRDNSVVKCLP